MGKKNTKIGPYKIIKRLGRGSFGVVYLVRNQWGQQKAIKTLALDKYSEDAKKLKHEAKVNQRLYHPGIAHIEKYVEPEDEDPYLVMEYAHGIHLGRKLSENGMSTRNVIQISWGICDALEHAHSHDIIHRDIKPHNIIIDQGNRVKITDFALARSTSHSFTSYDKTVKRVQGTPLYISPEQADGKQGDKRSDIYSLGAVMYHMVAGRPPFQASDATAMLLKHMHEDPEPITNHRQDVPERLVGLINKAIQKNSKDRFKSASAMKQAIAEIAAEEKIPLVDRQPLESTWSKIIKWPFRQWQSVATNILSNIMWYVSGAILVTVGTWWGFQNWNDVWQQFLTLFNSTPTPIAIVTDTPTPTLTPTGTNTPTVTPTPTRTNTPTISPTPSPTPILATILGAQISYYSNPNNPRFRSGFIDTDKPLHLCVAAGDYFLVSNTGCHDNEPIGWVEKDDINFSGEFPAALSTPATATPTDTLTPSPTRTPTNTPTATPRPPTFTPTNTPRPATNTPTASRTPTLTPRPATNTPTSTRTPPPTRAPKAIPTATNVPVSGGVLYAINFDNGSGNWPVGTTSSSRSISDRSLVNGKYRYSLTVKEGTIAHRTCLPNRTFTDFEMSLEAHPISGPFPLYYGVIFRRNQGDGYEMTLCNCSTYEVRSLYDEGDDIVLINWAESGAINNGGPNRINIKAVGPTLDFSVNDQKLTTITDDAWKGGEVCFLVGSNADEQPTVIDFDDLKITVP